MGIHTKQTVNKHNIVQQLEDLGYSPELAHNVINSASGVRGASTLIDLHPALIQQVEKIRHEDIVLILTQSQSTQSWRALLRYYKDLSGKGYTLKQLCTIAKQQGGSQSLKAVFDLTNGLLKLGFEPEDIRKIVSHSSASNSLREIAKHAPFLMRCGYSIKSMQLIASAQQGAALVKLNVSACENLKDKYHLSEEDIKPFVAEGSYSKREEIAECLESIPKMLDKGYTLAEIKEIVTLKSDDQAGQTSAYQKLSLCLILKNCGFDYLYVKEQVLRIGRHDFPYVSKNIAKLRAMGRNMSIDGHNVNNAVSILLYRPQLIQLMPQIKEEHYRLWFELLKIGYEPEQIAKIALRDDAIQSMEFILEHIDDFLAQGVGSTAIQSVALKGGCEALDKYLKQLPFRFASSGGARPGFFVSPNPEMEPARDKRAAVETDDAGVSKKHKPDDEIDQFFSAMMWQ